MTKLKLVSPISNVVLLDRDRQIIERIEKLMADPPEGSVVMEFTPPAASHVIRHWRGTHNRHEKPAAIRRYAADMSIPNGWHLNGSTIVFTDQHLLGDGQNRLLACISADKPFRTHVVFGIAHDYFMTIDQGRVRNPADVLTIAGVPHPGLVKQAVRWAELLDRKTVKRRTVFTPPDILALYETKHQAVSDWVGEARAIFRLNRQPIGMVMALLYTFDKVDPDFTAEFASAWAGGTYEPRFAPIGSMQTAIERIARLSTGRVHDVVRMAMIVNCWNAIRAGRQRYSIGWDHDRPFPTIK